MTLGATSIPFTIFCCVAVSLFGCSLRSNRAAAKTPVNVPQPVPPPAPRQTASEPVSVPQTQAVLPKPQPIEAGAVVTAVPEPAPAPAAQITPPARAPRTEPRQNASVPAPQPVPATPAPAAPPVARRLRPVESPAERQKLLSGIAARQKQVADILTKAKNRQLSDKDKNSVDRIQAFLEQTETALKDEDLQQAEALSNRALLLCQDLSGDK